MAGESQQTPDSVPDPTVLVTDAIARALKGERDYVDGQIEVLKTRIDGIDEATKVLNETVNRTPTEIQREVKHLRELADSQFAGLRDVQNQRKESVDKHFDHLDKVRAEDKREARSLVDLALAAQKEMTSTALSSANLAIDKAAIATDKRYDSLDKAVQEMRSGLAGMMPRKESEARHASHEGAVNTLIARITAIEASKVGGKEQLAGVYALAGFIVSLVVIAGVLAASGAFNK